MLALSGPLVKGNVQLAKTDEYDGSQGERKIRKGWQDMTKTVTEAGNEATTQLLGGRVTM